ncbi:MAG: pantoate--beta-alanine ligase [Acidimicrobiales bacterium]
MLRRAYLGLGSNLGGRWDHLQNAVHNLDLAGGERTAQRRSVGATGGELVALSRVYETDPVGGPPGQGPFLNLVVALDTERSPRELLTLARHLEADAERVRGETDGPRTLDVDVLWLEGWSVAEADLVVPHPRMFQRRFVLAPLADIDPDLVPERVLAAATGQVRPVGRLEPGRLYRSGLSPAPGPAIPVIADPGRLRAALDRARSEGRSIGFVPTMGALHSGHLSLIDRASEESDLVVVSIFVNPLQFSPGEDLAAYPRDLDADVALAARAGAGLVFAPQVSDLWPTGAPATTVSAGPLGTILEGKARPGHFDGVATVVTTLFNIVGPSVTVFGEKDFQQVAVIRGLVADLHLPVEVVAAPTVREADRLASSSRNRYLSAHQRQSALALQDGLMYAQAAAWRGEDRASALVEVAEARLRSRPGISIDYVVVADPATLDPVESVGTGARMLVAITVGEVPGDTEPVPSVPGTGFAPVGTSRSVRLIDNVLLFPAPRPR